MTIGRLNFLVNMSFWANCVSGLAAAIFSYFELSFQSVICGLLVPVFGIVCFYCTNKKDRIAREELEKKLENDKGFLMCLALSY